MTGFARVGVNALLGVFLVGVELVQVLGNRTRCTALGHDGHWTYKATSGEWLCRCAFCDLELGRWRP